ncbi:hypothetical protein LEMLEM_LOCUS27951, partial [Lemmus lemmus]
RVALLGGVALLEEVCHSHFLLPVNLDFELSALSPAPCLTVSCHASRHDDNGLNPLKLSASLN